LLKVNEIFYSIQGESSFAGFPCVFIRLTGCNLRCTYCDTQYAYKKGTDYDIAAILELVGNYDCQLVEITGGEPLIQDETPKLAAVLCDAGYRVIVETNGTQNIDRLKSPVTRVVDLKTPGSGESEKTDWMNIKRLDGRDEVKFVLTSQADYDWAKEMIKQYGLKERRVHFSPVSSGLDPAELARWILEDQLNVRLHLQLHRILWPDKDRGT
jgi:7-carboxy-7-deazaguanine synthase